jgi:hypothetical protein
VIVTGIWVILCIKEAERKADVKDWLGESDEYKVRAYEGFNPSKEKLVTFAYMADGCYYESSQESADADWSYQEKALTSSWPRR